MSRSASITVGVVFLAVLSTLALVWQDTRIIATGVWALGVVAVWGSVFIKAVRQWRAYRDRRSRGDVRSDGALFFVAVAAGAAIAFALFSKDVEDPLRQMARVFSAFALGAFLMAGVVKLTEGPPDP